MKIGILTQPLHFNYGGALQNWALQQILISLGHQPEMIFVNYYRPKSGLILKILRSLSVLKTLALKSVCKGKSRRLANPFSRSYSTGPLYMDYGFISRIAKSRKCYDNEDLLGIVKHGSYDAFIVGSDQVWRQEYSPRIESYFLDFLADDDKRPRVAYAASFGVEKDYVDSDKMPKCRHLLKRFNAISVREDEGIDILRRDFGIENATRTLDPTLLLDAANYRGLIEERDMGLDSKLVAYILDDDTEKNNIVDDVSIVMGSEVHRFSLGDIKKPHLSVSAWLASFCNACFIVTDSFHGCVFSILFNKPFIAIANNSRGTGRMTTLLKEFGLEDRLVNNEREYLSRKNILLNSIDYTSVNDCILLKRNQSIGWLKNMLS